MRLALLCPGRGSYTDATRGALPAEHPWVQRAEQLREAEGLPSLLELDHAAKFSLREHLRPANATLLIWLNGLLDAEQVLAEHAVVGVGGNSMGWYTALAVAGVLDFDDAFRLAQTVSRLQEEHAARHGGGQILYPLIDEHWRPDPAAAEAVRAALADEPEAYPSIHLGGLTVLAGTEQGLLRLTRALPPTQLGRNRYPFRLVLHGPYHTPLVAEVSQRAREALHDLRWRAPSLPLVDGRGVRHTPWGADPAELREYTLGEQLLAPYDFTRSVRALLREAAPEALALTGPGNTLGGVCGQILIAEGWRGLRSRDDLEAARERGESPILSLGAPGDARGHD